MIFKRSNNKYLILLLFFILSYGLNLFSPRDLWVQDEMRYGEVVREMLETGNWLVPHLNGVPYPDKPALYFWIVALVGSVLGQGELAFRIVSFLATLLAGVGVYQLGSAIAGKSTGYWASLIFGSILLTLIVGQIVRMDMLLTAAVVFAWLFLWRFNDDSQLRWLVLFWMLCAFSLAIKGPIALLFNVLPALVWATSTRGLSGLLRLRPLLGLMSMVGLVVVWLVAVYQSGQGAYLSTIWHQQIVGRTINSWSHKEPIYFYVVLLPVLLMPWTGVVLSGCYDILKQRNLALESIAIFAIVPLVAISLISGKLFIYLEPLMPAMAIAGAVVAQQIDVQRKAVSAWFSWPPVLFLTALGVLIFWGSQHYLGNAAAAGMRIAYAMLVLAAISLVATRLIGKYWLYITLCISVVVSCLFFSGMTTLLNPMFSSRALTDSIVQHGLNNRPVGIVNATRGIFNYYAKKTFTELNLNDVLVWYTQHPDAVIIIKTKDLSSRLGQTNVFKQCRIDEAYEIELKEYHVLADCRN